MYALHTRPGTGGFAVQVVLEEAGAQYRLIEVQRGERSAEFLKISPLGQVPVLSLPDGTVMTESAAMIIHLADTLAPGRLAPEPAAPGRADYLRWLVFLAVNLYTADLRVYYAGRYTADPAGADAVKASALEHMEELFAIIDRSLGARRFMLGDGFSAVDPYLLMLAYWHPEPDAVFARHKNLARLCETVREVPSVKAANEFHRIW